MSLGVLNNISALYAENNLNQTQSSLQNTLTQLSSGSVLNSGANNPAGLSLANGLAANSAALTQSATNASEGVGVLQVADGALSQVTNLLNSAVTLATEASNGTLNSSQDAAANQEYQSILSEINSIGSTTTYNSQQVFTGNNLQIYTGDSSATGSAIDSLHFATLNSASVGDEGGTVQQSSQGQFLDLSLDTGSALTTAAQAGDTISGALTFTITNADGTTSTIATTATSVQGLMQEINKDGIPGVSATLTTAKAAGDAGVNGSDVGLMISNTNSNVSLTTTASTVKDSTTSQAAASTLYTNANSTNTIEYVAGANEQSADLAKTDLSNASDSANALLQLNSAVSDVAAQRGYLGSQINTLNSVSNVESTEQENLTSAENSITATNYGQATTMMSQEEILTQTGISALAQANSTQQDVLKLLQ